MNLLTIILSSFISVIAVFLSVQNFSKQKIQLKRFIIHILLMLPLLTLTNLFINGVLKLIFIILLTSIALYFSTFNKNYKEGFYYAIVYELFAFVFEIILSIIFVLLTKLNMENDSQILTLLFSILNSTLIYLVSLIKRLDNIVQRCYDSTFNNKQELVYILLIILLLGAMMTFNGSNFKNDLSFYINVGMVAFVFITFIYIIYKDLNNNKLENNYNEMMEYVQKYEKIINDQGKKNHEYNNQLMVIKGYSHNPKKLEEYLNLIINEHKCGQNYTIRELSYFPDGGIKGLIYHKISKMEENNIKYFLFIDKNIKDIFEDKLDLKTYQDITKLLGIFLDNAIEATMLSDKKEVEIDFKKQDDCIIMDISNTFNNKTDIKQIGKKGFTTKGIGHGYGLSIVKDINKHNNNIESFNDIEDDKFKQTTIIYYK